MKLLTDSIKKELTENYRRQLEAEDEGTSIDFKPVVKFFTPDAAATWLLTELNPENPIAFGLCDLGMGFPELGYVDLDELASIRGKLGLPVERDLHFTATKTLSEYHTEARQNGGVL